MRSYLAIFPLRCTVYRFSNFNHVSISNPKSNNIVLVEKILWIKLLSISYWIKFTFFDYFLQRPIAPLVWSALRISSSPRRCWCSVPRLWESAEAVQLREWKTNWRSEPSGQMQTATKELIYKMLCIRKNCMKAMLKGYCRKIYHNLTFFIKKDRCVEKTGNIETLMAKS